MTDFKVGDKVRRLKGYEQSGEWNNYCAAAKLPVDGIMTIRKDSSSNVLLKEMTGDWGVDRFDIISNSELNNIGGKMTTKKVFNILAVNTKTGKVDKDISVVAEGERSAILKAYGVDIDNLTFQVTERVSFEEKTPQTVIIENPKK